ncbi:MAG: hypothetical protein L0I29_01465 [Hyphomicrobiales bacterium]|nr:hypothetical protein [Hyphomicrobiales bacterium]
MYPRGYYFYAMEHLNRPPERRSGGQVKVATRSEDPMAEVGMLLRLGAVMAIVVAAVAVVTSSAG